MTGVACDVLVVGAGLAGLTAARRLHAAKLDVRILEATDEIGGRVLTRKLGGGVVDLGGAVYGRQHRRLRSLVHELGLTERHLDTGTPVWRLQTGTFVRLIPPLGLGAIFQLARVLVELQTLARQVPVREPWTSHPAGVLGRNFDLR